MIIGEVLVKLPLFAFGLVFTTLLLYVEAKFLLTVFPWDTELLLSANIFSPIPPSFSTIIKRRHHAMENMTTKLVTEEDEGWSVASDSGNGTHHVQESHEPCIQYGCNLMCTECDTCFHNYYCTCIDSSVNGNMCKHIHLVASLQKGKEKRRYSYYDKYPTPPELANLIRRHDRKDNLKKELVTEDDEGWWVPSEAGRGIYFVKKSEESCFYGFCSLTCMLCDACIHDYSCTCIDCAENSNMCKHIHLIASLLKERKSQQSISDNEETEVETVIKQEIEIEEPKLELEDRKENVVQYFTSLVNNCTTIEELEATEKHIAPLPTILDGLRDPNKICHVTKYEQI